MGFGSAFAYRGPGEIFAEHAALSRFENDGARDFAIADQGDFDAIEPFHWPAPDTRFFAAGGFFTPDGRGRFQAVTAAPADRTGGDFP
ncbi:hypothetical protein ABTK34_19510, partial [Acinetobacter baumannii]